MRLKDSKPVSGERLEQDGLEICSYDLWQIHHDELEATLFLKKQQKTTENENVFKDMQKSYIKDLKSVYDKSTVHCVKV